MPDCESRIRILEEENATLRDRNEFLETEIGKAHDAFPIFLDLTHQESICLGVLLKNQYPRKSTFMAALYSDQLDDQAEEKIVDVFLCKLRKKIKPYGIEIETVWGQGYKMAEAHKATLRGLMEAT
jgi:two-component system cell cycle response regulator CtrA